MSIKVCLAGVTGWAGSELARSIAKSEDLDLVAGVARRHAGRVLNESLRWRRSAHRGGIAAGGAAVGENGWR